MRVTISHNKPVGEVKARVDKGVDGIFTGLPIAALQITEVQRAWTGSTLNFSFTAKAGFISLPVKGTILVEEKLITIDIDLPSFVNNFIPEEKVKAAVEGQIKGLLT